MKKHFIKTIGIGLAVACILGTTIKTQAEDKKPAAAEAKGSNRAIPFFGTINSIDSAAKTINIGKNKKKDIQITDQTKIKTGDGKPATLADAKVGDEVGGSYRDNGGKLEAASLRIGPKPEGDAKPKSEKKKKE